MQYGISTASLYPMLTEDVMALFAQRQIPYCEIFFNTISELSPDYVRALRETADRSGVRVLSAHPFTCAFEPFMLFTAYERRFRDGIEWHKRYFDAMNILGASIFVFHGDRKQGALPDTEYYERFAVLRDLGKRFGITVAQENVERCKSCSPAFLKEMIRYLDGDVSLVFDNKQARRAGVDCISFIEQFAAHICHVHISDYTNDCDCAPVTENSPHVAGILRTLQKHGYSGGVVTELYRSMLQKDEDVFLSYRNLAESLCIN